jgi:PAS domain S-box-containing protein
VDREQTFRNLIASLPDGVFIVQDRRISYANPEMGRLLGFDDAAELVGRDVFDLLLPEERPIVAARMRELYATGRAAVPRETRMFRQDGSICLVEAVGIRAEHQGQPVLVVVFRDQTLRKRAEAALKESEQRLQLALEAADMGIWDMDLATDAAVRSPRHDQIFGHAEPLPSWGVADYVAHAVPEDRDRVRQCFENALQSDVFSVEYRVRWPYQSIHWVEGKGHVYRDAHGVAERMLGIFADCTERRQTEEALRRAVSARDQVLGVVAHDLRNPLTSIIMQCSALALEQAEDPGRRGQRPTEAILRSAKRMNKLIQDLLDVALVEEGKIRLRRRLLPAADLVTEAVQLQHQHSASAQLELRAEIEDETPSIFADHDRLLQVFENLIGNAIKATPPRGTVTVGAARRGDAVLFWVSDTGRGISEDDLPHVFQRFWQGAEPSRRLGAGLGLFIVKGIVEAHGGRIWVVSTPGQGSTFFASIPSGSSEGDRPAEALH